MKCPRGHGPLVPARARGGSVWRCRTCGGQAATAAVLRRSTPRDLVMDLWRGAATASGKGPGPACGCPFCGRDAVRVRWSVPAGVLEVDLCRGCQVAWFDPRELERVPAAPEPPPAPTTPALTPEAARSLVAFEIEHHHTVLEARRAIEGARQEGWPDAGRLFPALLGLPVELDDVGLKHVPWTTRAVIAATAIASLLAFLDLDAAVARFGFVAADAWRLGGLTFVTSFFVHVSALHLLGNLWFLGIFGDDAEDHLRPSRFLLLLLLATLAGNAVDAAITTFPLVPAVGASGGISGVLVYSALLHPGRRLGMPYFYGLRWIPLPAVVWLFFWVALQVLGVWAGFGGVAYGAHLGGAAVGLLVWLGERRRLDRAAA